MIFPFNIIFKNKKKVLSYPKIISTPELTSILIDTFQDKLSTKDIHIYGKTYYQNMPEKELKKFLWRYGVTEIPYISEDIKTGIASFECEDYTEAIIGRLRVRLKNKALGQLYIYHRSKKDPEKINGHSLCWWYDPIQKRIRLPEPQNNKITEIDFDRLEYVGFIK